ncbi:hypothetical protein Tco_0853831, partial [Tanacetum coccineum]
MNTLAEYIIVARVENHPPMLEKSMYDSWASCIGLFIKGKKHGRMMLGSIDNGLLVYLTILYCVDGDDFYEYCDELRFIVINNPFWKICAYDCYVNIMHDYWIGWVRLPSVVRLLDRMGTPTDKYGYTKNYKKTVKKREARTRERKSEQKPEAEARKVK